MSLPRAIYQFIIFLKGSASLKRMLPAFSPDPNYVGLAIGDDETASIMYLKTLKKEVLEEEYDRIYTNLLEYCRLDTLAEVRLLEELYRLASIFPHNGLASLRIRQRMSQ
jgi:hypothetical protein